MMKRHGLLGLVLIVASGPTSGCWGRSPGTAKPTPPAKVNNAVKESQLTSVVLTPDAEKKLGLEVAVVERRVLPRLRAYGGEVVLPTNALLTVSAPLGGTLQLSTGKDSLPVGVPHVGAQVGKGQAMFSLVPNILTQAEQFSLAQAKLQLSQVKIDAEGQVMQAKVQVDAAKIALERAERLFREMAGTRKDVDDAIARLELAQKTYDAAAQRQSLVDKLELDPEKGGVKAVTIAAPQKGLVRAIFAEAGELVPAGAPLFEIMNVDTVWIKVPIYVGEAADIDTAQGARIGSLGDLPGAAGVRAKPAQAPPTAQAQAAAVDLYFSLANAGGAYRPGQRVCALLTLKGQEKSLGLPWSAVVHDIHGGAWVYVQKAENTYSRQRVQVRYVDNDWAVLDEGHGTSGLAGARVVTAGAAEVFGSEFGFGH